MKKIFWLIILVLVWYIISIFLAPSFADKVADLFWIKSFNEQIRWTSKDINEISTNVPSIDEFQETYNNTIKTVKDWIDKTKNVIDDTRATLSWAEDTYNKAVNIYDETTETVDKLKETFNDVEQMREKITWAVNKDIVK
jgi:peptidoglycan hydrolase CwlO-like protein